MAPDDTVEFRVLEDSEVDLVTSVLGLARLHQRAGSYTVAWIDTAPVAHAYLTDASPPEIQDVEVAASHRGRGIAPRLMAAVEQRARERGEDVVTLTVSAHKPQVQALYESLGYRDSGREPVAVTGTVMIRTGPLEVDDLLLHFEKSLR